MNTFGRAAALVAIMMLGGAADGRGECVIVTMPGAKPISLKQFKSQYELIFTGTVIRGLPESAETVFLVDQVWKGEVKREMAILVSPGEAGLPKRDRALLILARRCRECGGRDRIYDIDASCAAGIELNTKEAQDLLLWLGPGERPRH